MSDEIEGGAITPDGTRVYLSRSTGMVQVYEVSTRALVDTLNLGGSLNGVAIIP